MGNRRASISFEKDFLRIIDQTARNEKRSRSELIRNAVQQYVERGKRWDDLFAMGEKIAKEAKLKPEDVLSEIALYRSEKRKASG